jgi:hypothetical protein
MADTSISLGTAKAVDGLLFGYHNNNNGLSPAKI